MENTSKNTEQIYDTTKHLLLDLSFLTCMICLENCFNLYETSCCNNFICRSCKPLLQSEKCPYCKQFYELKFSKTIKKMLYYTNLKCPLCEKFESHNNITKHLILDHSDVLSDFNKIRNDEKLYELIIFAYDIKPVIKSPSHDHVVNLINKPSSDEECRGKKVFNFSGCNFSNKEIIPENEREKFLNNFCYKCEECDLIYCKDCVFKAELSVQTNKHSHRLMLKRDDNGWMCDGSKEEIQCFSGIDDFYQTGGMIKFRCYECDYDLCEKCAVNYLVVEEN